MYMSASDEKALAGLARSIDDLFVAAGHPPLGTVTPGPLDTAGTSAELVELVEEGPAADEASPEVEDDPLPLIEDAFDLVPEALDEPAVELDADPSVLEVEVQDPQVADLEAVELDAGVSEDVEPDDDGPDTVEMEAIKLDGFDTHVGGKDAAAVASLAMEAESTSSDDEGDEFVPTPLDLAVDAYLEGDQGRADEIDELGRQHMASQDVEAVARSIERLVLAAGEPSEKSTFAVAESLMYPLALDRVVRHMGLERDEGRRKDFYTICRCIGEPITPAIRNELGETNTDRLARRIYCEALTEMGPAGRDMIQEMVESENQFLVRNAVSILGDLGGEGAVAMATSALGNPDRRVRREALKALAKLGDESTGELVVGFLEDPDENVRLAAAVACGELKVARALRPLVTMLEATTDPDKDILLIRALGHLGDPGAVLSLEKHAVRTMFSRPRTDVRIAAYRALHQIGTPKTRQMLLEVAKDKDEDVKDAVKKMLYG